MKLSTFAKLFRKSINAPKRRRDIRTFTQGLTNSELLEDRVLLSTTDGNDQTSEAINVGLVTVNRSTTGRVDFATDVNMYAISVLEGQTIDIDLDVAAGSSLDSYVRLFDYFGRQLVANDNGIAPGESSSRDSYLRHTFRASGTYYIGVSNFNNSSYSPTLGTGDREPSRIGGFTGGYSLFLTPIDTNDQIGEAVSSGMLNVSRSATVKLQYAADVDMYAFTVRAGQTIDIDFDRYSGNLDSYIRLFNYAGTQLASNDNGIAPGETSSSDSYLRYTFSADGTYYIGVSNFSNSSYSPTLGTGDREPSAIGGYTGLGTLLLTPVDTNDQIGEAFSLGGISTTRTGTGFTIENAADVDLFSFRVNAGQTVGFDIDRPAGSLDSYIRLFNNAGFELARNDDGPAPGESYSYESYLEYTFVEGGTYYLGVSGFGNNGYSIVNGGSDNYGSKGAYTLTAVPLLATTASLRGTLYLNFEGANITNSQLQTWAGTDWAGSITSYLDEEGNGITVDRFLNGRSDRDAVIAGIMARLQNDLTRYGIRVQRVTGMGMTGVGATTLFFGNNNMATVGHVACDVDFNNNNRTDIAFIQDEDFDSADRTATALADVALHEAGHTFGLFHVNTLQNGVLYNETMGLRYSTTDESNWVRDTSYMDRTFSGFPDDVNASQNAHRVMLANFGVTNLSAPTAERRLSSDAMRSIFTSNVCMGHDQADEHEHEDDEHVHDGQFFNVAGLLNTNVYSFANVARMTSPEDRLVV